MKQLRAGALVLGAAAAVALAGVPAVKAGEAQRIEIVRKIGGRSYVGLSLEDTTGAERGARVKDVVSGSPAEKAGFKDGDVVVRWDGEAVRSAAQLARLVAETPQGRGVAVEVRRGQALQKLEVAPEAGRSRIVEYGPDMAFAPEPPEPPDAPAPPRAPRAPRPPELRDFDFRWHGEDLPAIMLSRGPRKLGIEYQPIEGQLAKYFKLPGDEGVLVTSVDEDGPAGKAGMKAGDVIVKLGTKAIEDSGDLHRALDASDAGSEVAVQVLREGRAVDLKVTLGGRREKRVRDEAEET
jgi:serine protease Do